MIEIQDIKANRKEEVIDLLRKENSNSYEFHVTKSTLLYSSTNLEIAIEYANLAFVGEQLAQVSDEFSYRYVSASEGEKVLYKITTSETDKLAEVLLLVSLGYTNPNGDVIDFLEKVEDFIDKVRKGVITPVCPDFMEEYENYLEEKSEYDQEDK